MADRPESLEPVDDAAEPVDPLEPVESPEVLEKVALGPVGGRLLLEPSRAARAPEGEEEEPGRGSVGVCSGGDEERVDVVPADPLEPLEPTELVEAGEVRPSPSRSVVSSDMTPRSTPMPVPLSVEPVGPKVKARPVSKSSSEEPSPSFSFSPSLSQSSPLSL